MKKHIAVICLSVLVTQLNAAAKAPKECFSSDAQRFTYEKSLSTPQDNEQITNCLKTFLSANNNNHIQAVLPILRKSNNLPTALPATATIFKAAKDAPTAFAAASALASVPEETKPYQKTILNIISSENQEDYKKTLAVIVLSSANAIDSGYTPFLTPALNAEDPVLQAYAAAAYAMLVPDTKTRFLNGIITLYGFDKTFALRAFQNTGLNQRELFSALRTAVKSEKEVTRVSAAEWIGDTEDKKLLELLFTLQYHDSPTISAAASALAANYNTISLKLKKEMKSTPSSTAAAISVMTYALLGSQHFEDIDAGLTSTNANEQANSARVVLSIAEILQNQMPYYKNPQLEEQRVKKFITPLGKLAKHAKDENAKFYADTAIKAIYTLINK